MCGLMGSVEMTIGTDSGGCELERIVGDVLIVLSSSCNTYTDKVVEATALTPLSDHIVPLHINE